MHICHVAHNYFPGIGLAAMYEFCMEEAKRGITVTAIVLDNHIDTIEIGYHNSVKLIKIPSKTISARSLKKIKFIISASKILRNLNCDIVHVYSNIGLGLLPILVGRKKDKKWLYDIRSGPVHSGFLGKLGIYLLRIESLFFDKVVVGSLGTKEMIFGGNEKKMPVFDVGVNINRFQKYSNNSLRKNYNLQNDQIILIFTGTLHKTRKLNILIQSIAEVNRILENKVVLFILGDGPDKENLIQLTEKIGLSKIVIFTGAVQFTKIPEYLSAANIGIAFIPNTPEYGPQPALKTAEMLACGLPVIATNTVGNCLFVKNGYNGEVCADDEQSIAKAIVKLINNPEKRYTYQLVSRISIEKYSYSTIVQNKVIPTYNSLLS